MPSDCTSCHENAVTVNLCYEILVDEQRRKVYDSSHALEASETRKIPFNLEETVSSQLETQVPTEMSNAAFVKEENIFESKVEQNTIESTREESILESIPKIVQSTISIEEDLSSFAMRNTTPSISKENSLLKEESVLPSTQEKKAEEFLQRTNGDLEDNTRKMANDPMLLKEDLLEDKESEYIEFESPNEESKEMMEIGEKFESMGKQGEHASNSLHSSPELLSEPVNINLPLEVDSSTKETLSLTLIRRSLWSFYTNQWLHVVWEWTRLFLEVFPEFELRS